MADACQKELDYIRGIYNNPENQPLLQKLKTVLSSILLKVHEEFKIPAIEFLSDVITEDGNLGKEPLHITLENGTQQIYTTDDKLKYLISDNSTIREKIQGITNIIYNSKLFSAKMFEYIMKNKNASESIKKRYTNIKNILNIQNNNISNITNSEKSLWKQIAVLDKYYAYKRLVTGHILTGENQIQLECDVHKSNLVEPLSSLEIAFFESIPKDKYKEYTHSNNQNILPVKSGKCVYASELRKNRRSRKRIESGICTVAALSGHTMNILNFCSLIGVSKYDQQLILLGLLIILVPNHHSSMEIFDAATHYDVFTPDYSKSSIENINDLLMILRGAGPNKMNAGRRKLLPQKTRKRVHRK
jgi:hypothetical protein